MYIMMKFNFDTITFFMLHKSLIGLDPLKNQPEFEVKIKTLLFI